ncbi:Protein of unknown function DUF2490 [Granulicella tundricola MP5ACTX9]|uniref:DUF2490 domain-containing protein n=2 Tax=Granulicella TaxID=940557 RepID=E8X0W2_GRATM|nr:Protein of unknown function DUF2490 [Granulicella tundricola MP5ACTX9]
MLATLIFLSDTSAAQMGGTSRSAWFSYFGDQPISTHWAIHAEGSCRRTFDLSQFEQVELRPGLTLLENRSHQSLVAYTFFRTHATDDGSFGPTPADQRQVEKRLFEQHQIALRLRNREGSVPELIQRFRIEQRWRATGPNGGEFEPTAFSQRARYRLTAKIPFSNSTSTGHYFVAYNEVYTNASLKRDLLNADVTYGALGTRMGRDWALEVGYQFRFAPTSLGVTGPQDHSLQVYLLSTAPFRHRRH